MAQKTINKVKRQLKKYKKIFTSALTKGNTLDTKNS